MDDDELARYRARSTKYKTFQDEEAKRLLESLGAREVKSVEQRGWFD
jgi:hypothetical protein